MKIVAIDDDVAILEVYNVVFQRAGYEVTLLNSPRDIFNQLHLDADLFLVDWLMSGYDGGQVCQFLKSHIQTKDKPLIVITASYDLCMRKMEALPDLVYEKPFSPHDLVESIDHLIKKSYYNTTDTI